MYRRKGYSYKRRGYRGGSSSVSFARRKKSKTPLLILIVVVLLVLCAAVVYFVFFFPKTVPDKTVYTGQPAESSVNTNEQSKNNNNDKKESSVETSPAETVKEGYFDGNVFVYDSEGYEMFYGTEDTAKRYAKTVSDIKNKLPGVDVYNMVVPTHTAFGLPGKYLSQQSDQKQNIDIVYSSYSSDVVSVDAYKSLSEHSGEYVYFHTDNHWTALGAYYCYQEFARAAEIKSSRLTDFNEGSIKDFTGALLNATVTEESPKGNAQLRKNTDTVVYYDPKADCACHLLESGSDKEKESTVIAAFAEGSNAYSAFIWGSNPYVRIDTGSKTGKKLCVIGDSYACAMVPFLVGNYDSIFVIDPALYEGSITDHIKKNKFTDVLILNSVMNANTEVRINELKSVS